MTLAQAQAAAKDLRTALLDHGVARVSIELQQGVAGSGWGPAPFKRVLGHHIASYPPGTPGLGLVKKGRTGANALVGPLANCYGGFDLTARIITLGWANHPGEGGPWSVPGWGTVPKDNGRPYILGWEFEGGYLDYTDEMHDFMARCGAGSLDWLGTLPGNPGPAPLECSDEHKGWAPGRKPDRVGYTTASGRARIAAARSTRPTPLSKLPREDSDMRLIQQKDRGIAVVNGGYFKGVTEEELPAAVKLHGDPVVYDHPRDFDLAVSTCMNGVIIGSTAAQLASAFSELSAKPNAQVDVDDIVDLLVAKNAGVSKDVVADALREVLRSVPAPAAG